MESVALLAIHWMFVFTLSTGEPIYIGAGGSCQFGPGQMGNAAYMDTMPGGGGTVPTAEVVAGCAKFSGKDIIVRWNNSVETRYVFDSFSFFTQ